MPPATCQSFRRVEQEAQSKLAGGKSLGSISEVSPPYRRPGPRPHSQTQVGLHSELRDGCCSCAPNVKGTPRPSLLPVTLPPPTPNNQILR